MKDIVYILLIVMIIASILLIERFAYRNSTWAEVVKITFTDILSAVKTVLRWIIRGIIDFIKDLFRPEPTPKYRWQGDYLLAGDLRTIANDFANPLSDINIVVTGNSGTPMVGIAFTPKKAMTKDEVEDLTRILLERFRNYLRNMGFNWPSFGCFTNYRRCVEIYLYYAEFPEDMDNFRGRYLDTIAEPEKKDYGILRDDELERELTRVS